jgi:hypothetical protein
MTWKKVAKKALDVGSQVANVAVHLSKNTSPFGLAAVGLSVANTTLKAFTSSEHPLNGWRALPLSRNREYIFELLKPHMSPLGTRNQVEYYEWKTDAGTLRWEHGSQFPSAPHVPHKCSKEQEQAILDILRRIIWNTVEGRAVYEAYSENWSLLGKVVKDDVGEAFPSELGNDIWKRVQPLHDRGDNTSILLFGPPGTGKSCLSRYLVQKMGDRYLRIRTSDLSMHDITETIKFLRPPLLLIDDLDRTAGSILGLFDEMKALCPLVVSVNSYNKLDGALLRPGRFDEIVEVQHLGDDVLKPLLKDVPTQDAESLRVLPIAYIRRYLDLKEYLGQDEATNELPKLVERYSLITGIEDTQAPPKTPDQQDTKPSS